MPGRSRSVELLIPEHDCPSRQSHLVVAIFNIIATIIGGGVSECSARLDHPPPRPPLAALQSLNPPPTSLLQVLSLPYAFAKAGWVLGTIMLALSALASDFTLYVLCSSSRRSGAKSYQAIARQCYGPRTEGLLMALLLFFLLLVLTAYMILLEDTATSLLEFMVGHRLRQGNNNNHIKLLVLSLITKPSFRQGKHRLILVACTYLALPLCLCKSLHALRYTCYLGFVSVVVLTVSIAYRSVSSIVAAPERLHQLRCAPG
jgi:amino acid permease